MKTYYVLSLFAFLMAFSYASAHESTKDIPPVAGVDINRYLGTWYEIARFPHRFEKDLVGVTATYTMNPNGEIEVLNQGYKKAMDGERKKAKGRARIPNPEQNGLLKVTFFLFFWADYKIIALDREDYSYAVVTSSSKNYLWILSRTPQMQDSVYSRLINFTRENGYDLSKLIKVQQR